MSRRRAAEPPTSDAPLHRTLRAQLDKLIADGSRKLLPSERELMAEYGLSRTTVRRAIQSLVQEGRVRPVHGKGNVILPLPRQSGKKILLLLPELAGRYQLEAFEAQLGALADAGLQALCRIVRSGENVAEVAKSALAEVEGVILGDHASEDEALYHLLKKNGKKVAVLRHKSRLFPYPYAVEDKEDAFRQLVLHLAKRGHRKIACVTILRDELRLAGLRKGFAEAGLEWDPELLIESYGRTEAGFQSAEILLAKKRPFTAVIAQNDECALGVMHRFLLAGIRIPQDVSLTGYDNLREAAGYPVPLTTSGADLHQLCNAVVEYLSTTAATDPLALLLPTKIYARASVARCSLDISGR